MNKNYSKHDIFYLVTAIALLVAWLIIPFRWGWYQVIMSISGTIPLIIAIVSFFLMYRLYDFGSKEKWVWLLLFISVTLLFFSGLVAAFGASFLYFVVRVVSIILMASALLLKLWFAGVDLDSSQKMVSLITLIGWIFVAVLSALYAEVHMDTTTFIYSTIFSFAEVFSLIIAIFVIMCICAKGWYIIAAGILVKSMGDILEPLGVGMGSPEVGYPFAILWFIGILIAAYGADRLRKDIMDMML